MSFWQDPSLLPCLVLLTFHVTFLMSPHGEDKYFMRSLRLSLAHAAPRCTQEGQTAETKTEEEVNVQPGNRQGLVFEIVHSHHHLLLS